MKMGFKNKQQQAAVMASLRASGRVKTNRLRVTKPKKDMTYKELHKHGIKLTPYGDRDKDGVKNKFDCRPLDPKRQGAVHRKLTRAERKLEREQDRLLRELDREKTSLRRQKTIQNKLIENKLLKKDIRELKKKNFFLSPGGRLLVGTGKTFKTVGGGLGKFLLGQ